MDADDEFGDLYTDVLIPSSATNSSLLTSTKPNFASAVDFEDNDDEDIIFRNPNPNPKPSSAPSLIASISNLEKQESSDFVGNSKLDVGSAALAGNQADVGSLEGEGRGIEEQKDDIVRNDDGFDLFGSGGVIPGLSAGPFETEDFAEQGENGSNLDEGAKSRGEEDWESDSEDDLQIVLNEKHAPIGRKPEPGNDDEEDEDGDDLVIVAGDEDQIPIQAMEEQEWVDDSGQVIAEGEKKEGAEWAKAGVAGAVTGRVGYSNHGYHPLHSQFKYVRPSAASLPGGAINASAGGPGQIRPPVNFVAGRGRADWRGRGSASVQKGYQSGFGLSSWGSRSEITLPSHKTVFDIDIEALEDKPWRLPGVDLSDYFSFGFDETSWKDYCKQLEQLRLEATMQSKIRVYESGRSDQEYDPDLPPELAAAAGIQEASAENPHPGRLDVLQPDPSGFGRGYVRPRPSVPMGRAIQVEGGYGERLPSIDTRAPRIRDSDSVIEIVLQGANDYEDVDPSNDAFEREVEVQGTDLKEEQGTEEDDKPPGALDLENLPNSYSGRGGDLPGQVAGLTDPPHNNARGGDGILPLPSEAPFPHDSGNEGRNAIHALGDCNTSSGGRLLQGKADRERCLSVSHGSHESVDPDEAAPAQRSDVGNDNSGDDGKIDKNVTSPGMEEVESGQNFGEEEPLKPNVDVSPGELELEYVDEASDLHDSPEDRSPTNSPRKQKLGSLIAQSTSLNPDQDTRSSRSDNSREKSGSKDQVQQHDSHDDEVLENGRETRNDISTRQHSDDEFRSRGRYEHTPATRSRRQVADRNHLPVKGREDAHRRTNEDLSFHREHEGGSSRLREKNDSVDRLRERDNMMQMWQRRDDDGFLRRPNGEDPRRRERLPESNSKFKHDGSENSKKIKEEYLHLKKRSDDGDWRIRHDRERPRSKERDDRAFARLDIDSYGKRKDEELRRRGDVVEKEHAVHSYRGREKISKRNRETDESIDRRRKDDLMRLRERPPDDQSSLRHRDASWWQREKDDRQRQKQGYENEDIQANGNREVRLSRRGVHSLDDKSRAGASRSENISKDYTKDYEKSQDYDKDHKNRHSEQSRTMEKVDETRVQHKVRNQQTREVHAIGDERSLRHDRARAHGNHFENTNETHHTYRERDKDIPRKNKEVENGDQVAVLSGPRDSKSERLAGAKRKVEEDSVSQRSEKVRRKGTSMQETGTGSRRVHREEETRRLPPKPQNHADEGGSDGDSTKRGRSKLERWASHKEKDNIPLLKASDGDVRNTESDNNLLVVEEDLVKEQEPRKASIERFEKEPSIAADKDSGDGSTHVSENMHVEKDVKEDERHLEAVAKLKKRKERFQQPLTSEKEMQKKAENEALSHNQQDGIRHERPARKRRWANN